MSALRRSLHGYMAKDLKTLTRRNIMSEVEKIADTGKRGAADDLRKHVYTFLQWAQNEGHVEHNVLLGYRKPKATRAERVGRRTKGRALTDDEIMGGQAQFSEALSMQSAEDEFGALHEWINKHLSDDLSLGVLAQQAGMSERSFSRHYAEATGVTPARAIERLRVEAARRLLSESRLPVKRISQRCGFGSEETMRRSILCMLSATPNDYRARFSS